MVEYRGQFYKNIVRVVDRMCVQFVNRELHTDVKCIYTILQYM